MANEWMERLKALDTASLSDALDSLGIDGGLLGMQPRSGNVDLCGRAFTVSFGDPSEEDRTVAKAADYIDEVVAGDVVVLANNGRTDCTVWGGILTKVATRKGIAGTVIDGCCRDVEEVQALDYPMFTKAVYMKTGKGRTKKQNHQVPVRVGDVDIQPGDYIKGDANGVLVIPQALLEETVQRAEAIRQTEERIIQAVLDGMRLDEARKQFQYHRPWETASKGV